MGPRLEYAESSSRGFRESRKAASLTAAAFAASLRWDTLRKASL